MNTKPTAYVVLGLDRDGKARAATVHAGDLQLAIKAAAAVGLKVGQTDTTDGLRMAKELPEAKLFATGKGLVPLVKRPLYDALLKLLTPLEGTAELGPDKPGAAADKPSASPSTAVPPKAPALAPAQSIAQSGPVNPWDAILVGSTVLWGASAKEGYYPCTVTAISKDKKKLTLKWRDWPSYRAFDVPRMSVGIVVKIP